MFHPNQITSPEAYALVEPSRTGACLIAGCPCKDARIVSHRRAAFFAAMAVRDGETADRIIAPDPAWRLPVPVESFDPGLVKSTPADSLSEILP